MLDVTGFVVVSLVVEESVTGDSSTGAKVVVAPIVEVGGGVLLIVVGFGISAGVVMGGPPAFLELEVGGPLLSPGLVVVAFIVLTGFTVVADTVTVSVGVNAGVEISWGATVDFAGLVDTSEGPCKKKKTGPGEMLPRTIQYIRLLRWMELILAVDGTWAEAPRATPSSRSRGHTPILPFMDTRNTRT